MFFHNLSPGYTIGYHGCDEEVGKKLLEGELFRISRNDWDWLGEGTYFWENDYDRALAYAKEKKARGGIKTPFVVGAVLTLGNCIDTLTQGSIAGLRLGYELLVQQCEADKIPLPENNEHFRLLDYSVIMALHQEIEETKHGGIKKVDSLRGLFYEGKPIYETSAFYSKTHIQICIRNLNNIKAVFDPTKQHWFANRDSVEVSTSELLSDEDVLSADKLLKEKE